jgi:hypothetical protein
MDQDREDLIDYRLHALHSRGDELEALASLAGMSREEVRQRISRYETRDVVEVRVPVSASSASPVSDGDARTELADALRCGDEFAFLDIIAENPEQFRWINPAALNGAEALRSFQAEQVAQLTAGESGQPSMTECVTVVLPNHPSPMASIELLRAIIPRAKKLVIISTRTALRTLLANP